jgi:hypothetical protein
MNIISAASPTVIDPGVGTYSSPNNITINFIGVNETERLTVILPVSLISMHWVILFYQDL